METNDQIQLDFQSLYDQFQSRILRYLINMVGEADAEDLTQEIFIKISKALPNFRGECKLSTWVYRIATNGALDRIRSSAYQAKAPTISDEKVVIEVDDRNIWTGEKVPVLEWQVVRKEMSECLQEYIQRLPESYRMVLALSEFEGLSNQEIAAILNVSIGAVKIRLHRARERLRNDLIANCPPYWVEGNEFVPDLKDI
jgi:RNA polymerase sigma-70 factor (ECF subfamily)